MRGLIRGVRLELETEPRMTRSHDGVRCKPIFRAEVTGETQLRAPQRLLRRVHAARQIGFVRRGLTGVTFDPFFGAAVTPLTADAVAQLKARSTLVARHVVGVTVEADLRRRCTRDTEIRCDAFGFGQLERSIGLSVPILRDPGAVLVEADILAWRREILSRLPFLGFGDFAVANAAAAGPDAEMLVCHVRRLSDRKHRQSSCSPQAGIAIERASVVPSRPQRSCVYSVRFEPSVTYQGLLWASR